MIRALALLLIATAAHADKVSISGSTVTLQPTDRAGAMAEMIFDNRASNDHWDNDRYEAHLGQLTVPFRFTWSETDDTIQVDPPDGVVCLPTSCVLQLREDTTGTILLFSLAGVGA